jgi:peptidoglycan/xylan/chitin deacetylase (PgdA/CDA1 family)
VEVAITFDDLPAHGDLPRHTTRLDLANQIIKVLKKHHIQGVYGLINAEKIQEDPNNFLVLESWIKHGHLLGNHTFSHLDLGKVSADKFIKDIKNNDKALIKLMRDKNYKYFRYPFLSEGNTLKKRDDVRNYLFNNQYKIAEVTVDFFEYEWADPYIRCLIKKDKKSIKWLKTSYIKQSINALTISHALSMMLFNRDIKNILLIHINAMTASMLDELLTAYESHGVKFISLSHALNDEIYNINPNVAGDRTYTFLNQIRLSRGLKNPAIVTELYNSLPEEKLEKICR